MACVTCPVIDRVTISPATWRAMLLNVRLKPWTLNRRLIPTLHVVPERAIVGQE
jgi:hypothetical protein